MHTPSNQIEIVMKEFEKNEINCKKSKRDSDNDIFSTISEFSDVPDEDEGVSCSLTQRCKVFNLKCHGSEKLSSEKGKFKEYYENKNQYCDSLDTNSPKTLRLANFDMQPLKTPRCINIYETNEDMLESKNLFDLSISESSDEICLSSSRSSCLLQQSQDFSCMQI